jgi:hypothetical protein
MNELGMPLDAVAGVVVLAPVDDIVAAIDGTVGDLLMNVFVIDGSVIDGTKPVAGVALVVVGVVDAVGKLVAVLVDEVVGVLAVVALVEGVDMLVVVDVGGGDTTKENAGVFVVAAAAAAVAPADVAAAGVVVGADDVDVTVGADVVCASVLTLLAFTLVGVCDSAPLFCAV